MYLRIFLLLVLLSGAGAGAQDTGSEPVSFVVTITNVSGIGQYRNTGVAGVTGGRHPGETFEFTLTAAPGDSLSFVSMLTESNNLFFAPNVTGIALYDVDGSPIKGDVTGQIGLWDAGTELNQPVGKGSQQASRQPAPGTGDSEQGVVRRVDGMAGFPAVADIIRVRIAPGSRGTFTVSIDNISNQSLMPTSLSPLVWVVTNPGVSGEEGVFFTPDAPERGNGLEALAEAGDPRPLAAVLSGSSPVMPLLPVVWAVHGDVQGRGVFFTPDAPEHGNGLEALAEDGSVPGLTAFLAEMDYRAWGVASIPDMEPGPGALVSGNFYTITFEAVPGDYLSFVTPFVESNDLFFAPDANGIALFDSDGQPVQGDITRYIRLWDAGTEVNEASGIGANQSPRQPAPNTGKSENGVVRRVEDFESHPPVPAVMRVTLTTGY